MGRRHPQTGARVPQGQLWESITEGAAIWGACRRYIRARRLLPSGWSWADWWDEIEAVCLARAIEASSKFDPARGVPLAGFLYVEMRYASSERYRRESRFAARCRADSTSIHAPESREERTDFDERAAVWRALHAMPSDHRRLLERLLLDGETEARLACELGVSQATISRRKHAALREMRARFKPSHPKIMSGHE
jgi:RNA polymerase sigma factor (sigma-70 family)